VETRLGVRQTALQQQAHSHGLFHLKGRALAGIGPLVHRLGGAGREHDESQERQTPDEGSARHPCRLIEGIHGSHTLEHSSLKRKGRRGCPLNPRTLNSWCRELPRGNR
jgi:hypothetical protein